MEKTEETTVESLGIPEIDQNYAVVVLKKEWDRLFEISEKRKLTTREQIQFMDLDKALDLLGNQELDSLENQTY